MELFGYTVTIDAVAFVFFLLCFFVSVYLRERARRLEGVTGKKIRSMYRKSWVETILKKDEKRLVIEMVRNGILVSTALMSAIIISFGFVIAQAPALDIAQDILTTFRIAALLALLMYAFFMLLLEGRTLVYIPIVFGASEELIKKYEGTNKAHYVAKLLHESFDHFSNAIRAIVFVVALLVWFYNTYLFMLFTVVLTILMVREDFGRKSAIMLF